MTTRFRPHPLSAALAAAFLSCASMPALAQSAAGGTLPRVEVVGTTPVPGTGVPRDQIPANVQTASDRDLRRSGALNLPDFLAGQAASVNTNEVQGNPYQLDVNFRGFSASPLLGVPQGLSVFQDGVRVNESFGDIVNWDLIPKNALASLVLMPGSNPVFGLNTLGGALALTTKSGDTHPGTEVELQAGSFGRRSVDVAHGRRLGEAGHVFLSASALDEDGWRDFSPSRVRQLFVKTGLHTESSSWDLSLTHADNRMIGNGPLPETMLAQRREQVYTLPDITRNRLTMLALNGRVDVAPGHELAATAYWRDGHASTLNGDLNDDYDPPAVIESGVENRTATDQTVVGFALQSTWTLGAHRLTLGASHDRGRSSFRQTEAEGRLDANRGVVPEDEPELDAAIDGRSRTSSLYLHDLVALRPDLQLTLAGRYNRTRVTTADVGRARFGLDTRLDADATYTSFNPAVGLTWQASPVLTAYANIGQGSRAPSPIELGCSDPQNACVLPNALQSDPPLDQVISRTIEAGMRGRLPALGDLRWNAGVFHTVNRDDLLFISNGLAAGYFSNFGRTQRQGLELGLASQPGAPLGWAASYSYLRATFESPACIVAEGNSTAETSAACTGDDEIEIRPGNRLPGLPAHTLKLSAHWQPTEAWAVGVALRAFSSQYVRGNENNAHRPDGVDFSGTGQVGGFAVVDLTGSWQLTPQVELFGRIANLFDRRYASAGILGENAFDGSGALLAPADWRQAQFVGPGAPRAAWIGLRVTLDGR